MWTSKERGRFNSGSCIILCFTSQSAQPQSQPSKTGVPQRLSGADPNSRREVILTHRQQVPAGLYNHVPVQGPLSRVRDFPLLLREFNGHILEGHLCLK